MKKDIDWLNNELEKVIKDVENDDISFAGKDDYDEGYIDGIRDVQSIVNQLDEPEVLSQEWVNGNSVYASSDGVTEEYVHVDDLQNLLVPKQEVVKRAQIPEWIIEWYQGANNELSTLEDVFDNLSHGTNYSTMDSDILKIRIMKYGGYSKMYEALSHIYFGAYDIEKEEQRYIVSDNSSIPLLIKDDSGKVMSYDSQIAYNNPNGTIELTEQEIKDYDERYLAFKVPVEEMK